jgi:hypothetical protein
MMVASKSDQKLIERFKILQLGNKDDGVLEELNDDIIKKSN